MRGGGCATRGEKGAHLGIGLLSIVREVGQALRKVRDLGAVLQEEREVERGREGGKGGEVSSRRKVQVACRKGRRTLPSLPQS